MPSESVGPEEASQFDSVPNEIVHQVMKNLGPVDLQSCSRVATRWYGVANSIWDNPAAVAKRARICKCVVQCIIMN